MKSTGIVRAVDSVGRFVIPMELRRKLNITENDADLEVFVDDDKIILRKYSPSCLFCKSLDDIVVYNDQKICKSCIEKLYTAANESNT